MIQFSVLLFLLMCVVVVPEKKEKEFLSHDFRRYVCELLLFC